METCCTPTGGDDGRKEPRLHTRGRTVARKGCSTYNETSERKEDRMGALLSLMGTLLEILGASITVVRSLSSLVSKLSPA